jgi:hypothetical protein
MATAGVPSVEGFFFHFFEETPREALNARHFSRAMPQLKCNAERRIRQPF